MKTRLAFACLLAVPALIVAGCGGSDTVPTGSVAVVDGTEITRADLDTLLKRAKLEYGANYPKAGTPEYQNLQSAAVAYLVGRVVNAREADKLGIEVTEADVDKRLQQVLAGPAFGGDMKKLETALKQRAWTMAQLREDLRALVISERLAKKVDEGATVDDAAVKAAYAERRSEFEVQESREVRHILLQVNKADGVTVDYPKSLALANDVYDQLKAGGDFTALAKKYSKDPSSASEGGRYMVERGKTVAPFEQTSFLLDLGEVSRPVKTQFGYHLIEPIGAAKPAHTTPYAKAAAMIRAELLKAKRQEVRSEWAAEVRKKWESKTVYAAGFEPPATEAPATTTLQE